MSNCILLSGYLYFMQWQQSWIQNMFAGWQHIVVAVNSTEHTVPEIKVSKKVVRSKDREKETTCSVTGQCDCNCWGQTHISTSNFDRHVLEQLGDTALVFETQNKQIISSMSWQNYSNLINTHFLVCIYCCMQCKCKCCTDVHLITKLRFDLRCCYRNISAIDCLHSIRKLDIAAM